MTAATHASPTPHEVLTLDLPKRVEMPALDAFTPGGARGTIPLEETHIHIQWASRNLNLLFDQQIHEVRLRRYFAGENDNCVWRDCTEIGKHRIGGRLAHFKHIREGDMTTRSHAAPPKDPQGTHIRVWCLPIDRGTNKMQVTLKKRDLRHDKDLDACWPEVLDALRLRPPAPGHLMTAGAVVDDGTLRITALNVPKITRPWGSFGSKMPLLSRGCELVPGHPEFKDRLSVFPRGSTQPEKFEDVRRFADHWALVLSDLSTWMGQIETELQREATQYDETFSNIEEVHWSVGFENGGKLRQLDYSRSRCENGADLMLEGSAKLTPGGKLKTKLH